MAAAVALAGSLLVAAPSAQSAPSVREARAVQKDPRIVFQRQVYASRIHVSNRTGSWTKPLTGARAEFSRPRWHPSGRRILYAEVGLNRGGADLMLMGPRGQNKTVLLPGRGRHYIDDMAWSPDGQHIALAMGRGRTEDVWVYSLATGELRPLGVSSFDRSRIWTVDWSTTGTIAFSAFDFNSPTDDSDLYLVQPDGSDLRQLTDTEGRSEERPRFSPDGTQMVYTASVGRCRRLVVANADGSDAERVRIGCGIWGGSWSPNSRRLLVERYNSRAGKEEIWDMTIDGTRGRFIAVGEYASWRPQPPSAISARGR